MLWFLNSDTDSGADPAGSLAWNLTFFFLLSSKFNEYLKHLAPYRKHVQLIN
jgi:hypothetical protein